ncbi:hypothetical protein BDR07DRAFT_1379792 [Suillus spraguei]|nr:hypothetical protein BDR07DRAFT_1379792 [Suillus spraguei]
MYFITDNSKSALEEGEVTGDITSNSAKALNGLLGKAKECLDLEMIQTTKVGGLSEWKSREVWEYKEKNMSQLTMASGYNPTAVKSAWYDWWEAQGFFKPQTTENGDTKLEGVFVVLMPPTNITGSLHISHALTTYRIGLATLIITLNRPFVQIASPYKATRRVLVW